MIDDAAVRSVRVAVALCDRFGELLKGPSVVKARKQNYRLVGVSGDEEGLSLRIGEVQQIYPEMWRHLDEARTAFAARGIDVTAYDEIRAGEGIALGAAVDMTSKAHGHSRYGYQETVKSANFNVDGYKRAVKAYQALMTATPDIPWAAIAKKEADDPNIAAFTRSTTTKRYVMFGLLGCLIAAPFIYVWNAKRQEQNKIDARRESYQVTQPKELSAGERAAIEKAVAEVKRDVAAAHQAWVPAFDPAALAALKPSANPCSYKFKGPTQAAADRYVKYGTIDSADQGDVFYSYKPNHPVPDDDLVVADQRIQSYEQRLLSGYAGVDVAGLKKQVPAQTVVFIVDTQIEPAPAKGTAYTPGQVAGRAYVFSIPQKKIVCTGVIDVKNAPDQTTPPNDQEAKQMLFRELEIKLRQALATELRAI